MIYFISDLHFGHQTIRNVERFEFETIEEHDKKLVEIINSVVKDTDTLYILGDIGNIEPVRLINGRKILIKGNHDKMSRNKYLGYFAEVYDYPVYFNRRVLLSHEPHPVEDHILNIHGHLHGSVLDSKNHLNLSAAMVDYKPMSENDIQKHIAELPKANRKFLQEWFADLYVFSDTKRFNDDVIMDENNKVKLKETIEHRKTFFSQKEKNKE